MSGRMPRSENSEDEDDFLEPESTNTSAVSSRLGSLFSHAGKVEGNASLTYKAPKQPGLKEENSASDQQQKATGTDGDGAPIRVLHATAAHAFLLKDGQYVSQGMIGVAILGNRLKKEYKILMYLSNKQPIGQATITPSMGLNVSANNYISLVDDRSASWSLALESENQLLEFLKWVLAIKGLLFDDHHKEILSVNIEEGEGNAVGEGDALEIEYTEFLVEDGPTITEFNGNLNSNQKPLRVKLGKGEAPKGWMDGLLGMKKRGQRLFVIPPDLGYSGHDSNPSFPTNTPLMVYAIAKRVKFSSKKRSGTGTDETARERKLSTDSAVSSNVDISIETSSDLAPKPNIDDNGPQKSASESDVHKKADLINRMARIGHAVMGAAPLLPPSSAEAHDHGAVAQGVPTVKPVAPPRPPTLQNPLAVVCADVSLARAVVTQTTAGVTKSSSDGSISPRGRSAMAMSNGTTAVSQVLPQSQHAFGSNMIPSPFPSLQAAGSALPYMYPFAYPPQSYFLQPPFLPPSLPPSSTSDFSSLASSAITTVDKQAILEEIQKCHLHLQDALTKTLVTNLSGILKKFSEISDAVEAKLGGSHSPPGVATTEAVPRAADSTKERDSSSVSDGTLTRVMSKLDQIDASVRSFSSPDVEPILAKLADLGEQIGKIGKGAGESQTTESISETSGGGQVGASLVMERMEGLAEQVSLLQTAIEKVNAMHAGLVAENEWKEKYEKLKSQALAMKEQYEGRIQALEEQAREKDEDGRSGALEQEKVKKIMNAFYKSISQRFPSGEQFESDVVRRMILETVKESTLRVLSEETDEKPGTDESGADSESVPSNNVQDRDECTNVGATVSGAEVAEQEDETLCDDDQPMKQSDNGAYSVCQ